MESNTPLGANAVARPADAARKPASESPAGADVLPLRRTASPKRSPSPAAPDDDPGPAAA